MNSVKIKQQCQETPRESLALEKKLPRVYQNTWNTLGGLSPQFSGENADQNAHVIIVLWL